MQDLAESVECSTPNMIEIKGQNANTCRNWRINFKFQVISHRKGVAKKLSQLNEPLIFNLIICQIQSKKLLVVQSSSFPRFLFEIIHKTFHTSISDASKIER